MTRFILLLGSSLFAATAAAQTPGAQNAAPAAQQQTPQQQKQAIQALVAQGKDVFDQTCGNQYCHGPGGKGAQGPKLVDVPMSPDTVRATVRQGRTGTPMAPFKDVLEPAQIDAVIAYVLNISSGGKLPTAVAPPPPPGGRPPEPPPISTTPIAIGKETGTPSAGAQVFFDLTNMASCRTCHTYNKRGGPLGLDFALAHKSPEDVLAAFAKPRKAARGYGVVTVKLNNGTKLTGIRGNDTEDSVRVFDVAIPPVRRSFLKDDVVDIQASKQGIFDHTKLKVTHQQLLDVAALLSTTPAE